MTEEAEASEKRNSILDQSPGVDWALAMIVYYAERGIEIGITITVGGVMIGGQVISGRKYFQSTTEAYRNADKGDGVAGIISDTFSSFADLYPPSDATDPLENFKPTYIHLANARWLLADGRVAPSASKVFWRGKLSSVDGFQHGVISND